jgi:FkbM family methyltransferase
MNIKKKFIYYVRQSEALNSIFTFLIKSRPKNKRLAEFESRYRSVVKGGEVIIFVENFKSEFFVDPRSELALRIINNGSYENDILSLIQKIWKGGSIVNIGANVGFWAVALPKLLENVHKVVAIEPNQYAFKLLEKNIVHNGLVDVVYPVQALISADKTEVTMEIIRGMPEYSSIGSIVHPAVSNFPKEKILVQSLPLDEVEEVNTNTANFNLLLIDVEGAEYLVFQGSQKFILKNRPITIFECSDKMLESFGSSVKQIVHFWRQSEYILINVSTMKEVENESFYYDGEILAIPKELFSATMQKINGN